MGGAGIDTLRICGSGVSLDLTAIGNAVHRDLEVIDITGSGNNTLILARGDVLALRGAMVSFRAPGSSSFHRLAEI